MSDYETKRIIAEPCSGKALNKRLKESPWFFEIIENYPEFADMTVEERILWILRKPKQVTTKEAQNAINSTKFRARVTDLRKRGYEIDGPMVPTTTGKKVKDYRLQRDPEEGIKYDWIDPIRSANDVEDIA